MLNMYKKWNEFFLFNLKNVFYFPKIDMHVILITINIGHEKI